MIRFVAKVAATSGVSAIAQTKAWPSLSLDRKLIVSNEISIKNGSEFTILSPAEFERHPYPIGLQNVSTIHVPLIRDVCRSVDYSSRRHSE